MEPNEQNSAAPGKPQSPGEPGGKSHDKHNLREAGTDETLPTSLTQLTRYLTEEERAQVERIELDPDDLEQFMRLIKQGLLRAASRHDAAVQDNFALRAETSIRLSRPVLNTETGDVDQLAGEAEISSQIRGKKVYIDPHGSGSAADAD